MLVYNKHFILYIAETLHLLNNSYLRLKIRVYFFTNIIDAMRTFHCGNESCLNVAIEIVLNVVKKLYHIVKRKYSQNICLI